MSPSQLTVLRDDSSFLKELETLLPFYKCSVDQVGANRIWGWSSTSIISCSSAYKALHNRGILDSYQKSLWRIKVPLKVKIFIWLMLDKKILTQDVLIYRGCNVGTGWHLCQQDMVETRDHILWDCVYVVNFWRGLMMQYNIAWQGVQNIRQVWLIVGRAMLQSQRLKWNVIWAAGAWALWRERNRRVFFK